MHNYGIVWWIVNLREPLYGLQDGNVQVMLSEDTQIPVPFLSPASAYAWAESEGLDIDNRNTFVVNKDTREIA